MTLVTSLLQFL